MAIQAADLPPGGFNRSEWEAALDASAPAGVLFEHFVFAPAGAAERARILLDREGRR